MSFLPRREKSLFSCWAGAVRMSPPGRGPWSMQLVIPLIHSAQELRDLHPLLLQLARQREKSYSLSLSTRPTPSFIHPPQSSSDSSPLRSQRKSWKNGLQKPRNPTEKTSSAPVLPNTGRKNLLSRLPYVTRPYPSLSLRLPKTHHDRS